MEIDQGQAHKGHGQSHIPNQPFSPFANLEKNSMRRKEGSKKTGLSKGANG